jgi:hypothetical protein
VIHDVLQHDDSPRPLQQRTRIGQLRTVHRRQRTAVQVVAGELLQHRGLPHEHRHLGVLGQQRRDVVQPLLLQQHRARTVAGGERARDDFGRLCDVEAALRLGHAAQGDVGEPGVVGEAVGGQVGHAMDLHRSRLPVAGNKLEKRPV